MPGSVAPEVETATATSSLSGHVFAMRGAPIVGVEVTLTGVDDQGNSVTLTAITNDEGVYTFNELRAGIYTVQKPALSILAQSSVGTVDGDFDGSISATGDLIEIVLGAGQNGINYDFRQTAN